MGLMSSARWQTDPRTMAFTLSRYKFVAKMLAGRSNVLEIGCGDGFASRIVRQTVGRLTITDFDPVFIADFATRNDPQWQTEAKVHDILAGPLDERFDGIYSLDVLEHIDPADESRFMANLCASLAEHGVAVVGMPSLESQVHASPASKAGHVNCKSGPVLRRLFEDWFHVVLVFSMNDEVVHTGFEPMANYLLVVATGAKRT
jgi:2-polyprenyl-3-methyl-5-hydroxy-6-metoxy-1,4-benzoquinol methylase